MKESNNFLSEAGRTLRKALFALCLVCAGSAAAYAQHVVKGTVSDPDDIPLPGVAVVIEGSLTGVTTDIDGNYSIEVPDDAALVFSFIGMEDQVLPVEGRAVINVVMEPQMETLDEIVVVGYGTAKKQSLTGAVSAIKGDELLKAPSTNVSSLIGGRVPGVSSVQVSGEPGDDQAALRIRGSRYDVTYIVDGMPRSINDIDPNDIESISVLKDGVSAAVYGLQGAGGVILITTKKGASGKAKVNYTGSVGISMNANFPEFMDGPQFAYYYNMADMMDQLANGSISDMSQYSHVFTQENINAMLNGDPSDGWDNVNYIDKVFGTGINQKHNVSVQGGNKDVRYFTSFGYQGQKGNIDNFTFKRYNFRTNVEANVGRSWHITAGIAGSITNKRSPGYASGGTDADANLGEQGWLSIAHQAILMHPYLPEKWNGRYTATSQRNTSLPNSPLAAIYESGYRKVNGFNLQTNVSIQYDVPWVKGLNLKVTGAYDYSSSHNKNLNTPYELYVHNMPTSTSDWTWASIDDPRGTSNGINLGEGQATSQQLVGQGSINYANTFGKHNIEALALVELRDYRSNNMLAYNKNMSFAELPELGFGEPADEPIDGYSDASRSVGYVFRLKYDYANKYLAEITGRYDGSYKFAGNVAGKRWGFFPSASVAWRISEESFMDYAGYLDDLKIRASVGLLGSDASASAYAFLSTYSLADGNNNAYNTILNQQILQALRTSVVANPNLSWEKTLTYNVGLDFTLWGGLLGAEFDAFYNYTFDMLTYMGGDFPPSMGGYYNTWENYSRMDSKGLELLLTHRNSFDLAGRRFTYGIGFNISYATNRWLRYPDSPNTVNSRKNVGKRVDGFNVWIADGLYRSEEEIDNSAWYSSRPNVGDIKYRDLNGDGQITEDDRTLIGRSNRPELTYGLNIDFTWMGFDFNAQFTGGALFDVSLTGTYYNGYDDNTVWTQAFKENANSPLYLVQNAYTVLNPDGEFPRLTLGKQGHGGDNGLASTFWLRDGKYLRLKSAQLGYSLPRKWLKHIKVENLRIFIEGSNLFTIDGLPEGIDPESPGVNNGYYPQQRTVMGGISLTF